ncbi:uncharacterized protein LOC127793088 [Diospyros lotus]|uniref:uncharacterized protein LOC127793088 n=1 Tax=Diospyros lotus TaxID=55363 RepID=UPI0022581E24|nr:uncharacterized protein LOC127793088 [Diospyros lotus]
MGKFPHRHELRKLSSLNLRSDSVNTDDSINVEELHRYTSLKDIIETSPPRRAGSHDPSGFDSANISIRNELVKHAASVYVQSAAILIQRDQNVLARFWENLKHKLPPRSCWRAYVGEPLRACFEPVLRLLNCAANKIARARRERFYNRMKLV